MSNDSTLAPPLGTEAWPQALAGMRGGFASQLNVYKVMAHHPALLVAWQSLRQHVVVDTSLGKRRSEIVILRVGHRWGSTYEWGQHVVRGRQAGLTDAEIERARRPPAEWPSGTPDTLLMQAVDALLDGGSIARPLQDALVSHIGLPGVFDVMATVGMYSTLAFIVKTFATPLEPDIRAAAGAMVG